MVARLFYTNKKMNFETEQKKHLKQVYMTVILTILVGWLNCFQANAQGTTSLYVGQNTILSAPNPPSGAALNQVAWGCSHKAVKVEKYMTYGAKVTVNEYFTGSAEVRCDYYYYWYDKNGYMHTNNATTYYLIKCYPVNLTVSPTSMSLNVGEYQNITFSYSPSNVSPKPTIRFFSSNTNVASVDQEGRVKAVGSGNATITISNSSGPDATCSVSVKSQRPTGISLPGSLSLVAGESKTITPTVTPSGAKYSLTWTSSNSGVASVSSSGRVTGVKAGSAYITATIDGYNYSDDCYVTVEKSQLTLKANPSGGMLEQGAKVALTASNNDAAIYYTLDGRIPNQNSTRYTSPIPINQSLTLKAIAYHSDYKTSDVLTANYEVTSLKVVSMNPENGATNIGREIIPSVTFNTEIRKGDNFSNIKLQKDGTEEIKGELIISGNTLHFVSQEELGSGNYKLIIPQNSVISYKSEVNFAKELIFSVRGLATETIKKIGGGRMLKTNGEFYLWGRKDGYRYPDPSMEASFTPVLIYDDIVDYLDASNTYILKSDGILMGWGGNYNSNPNSLYQSWDILGDGTKETRLTPVTILSDVKTITYDGSFYQGAIKTDNTLWTWGRNEHGQIGNGKKEEEGQLYPVKVLDDVKDVSLSVWHAVALKYDGSMWVWGAKEHIGTSSNQYRPMQKMTHVAAVSTGNNYVLALKEDGTAWAFGENDEGQIGDGTKTYTYRSTPYKVLSDVQFIEAHHKQNIAIKRDGSLWRWGLWRYGFGVEKKFNWLTPKKILDDVVYAHSSEYNCFALKKDGTLWGQGENDQYQLGTGTNDSSTTMIKILDDVVKFWIRGGFYAMKSDGSVWGWGTSYVGDGSTYIKSTPTKILDGPATKYPDYVGIEVNKASSLPVGEKLVFQTVIKPSDSSYGAITWSIEDENVATISQRGVVTAKAPGKTTVNLEVDVDGITYVNSHDLTVTEATGIIDVQKNNVKMSVNNSILHLENLNGGEHFYVYSASGICIYDGVINGKTANILLHEKGLYLVKIGNQTNKVLNP